MQPGMVLDIKFGQEHSVSAKGHDCAVVLPMPAALDQADQHHYINSDSPVVSIFQVDGLNSPIHLHLCP